LFFGGNTFYWDIRSVVQCIPFSFVCIFGQLRFFIGNLQLATGNARASLLLAHVKKYDQRRSEKITRPSVDTVTAFRYLGTLLRNAVR